MLRDGRHILTAPVAELDHERLVAAMVGAELARASREQSALARPRARPPARRRGLSVQTPLGSVADVSLGVDAGECLGLFGLRGSGTAAIADAVAGLVKPASGTIELDGVLLKGGRRAPPSSVESAMCPRTGTRAASCRRSASPRT